jgi:hypothetical protein
MPSTQGRDEWRFIETSSGPLKPGLQVVDSEIGDFAIISNSAWGPAAKGYTRQLLLILERLTAAAMTILRIEVDSKNTSELDLSLRTLNLKFPIDMAAVVDHAKLRQQISSAQYPIGQAPNASGGNGNKRIQIHVRSSGTSKEEFAQLLFKFDNGYNNATQKQPSGIESVQKEVEDNLHQQELVNRGLDGPVESHKLVLARRGQGVFRANVESREPLCRVTGVSNPRYLRASHIKPWSKSNDVEKLDGNNGLMLAPHVDLLFDEGFISFEDDGTLIVSKAVDEEVLSMWKIPKQLNVGPFTPAQCVYLAFHRVNEFERWTSNI